MSIAGFSAGSRKPTIEDKLRLVFSNAPIDARFGRKDIISKVLDAYPDVAEGSVLPSDRCYNITNAGLPYDYSFRIFEYLGRAEYRYLGERYPYCGKVTWKGEPCGVWTNGVLEKGKNWPCRA